MRAQARARVWLILGSAAVVTILVAPWDHLTHGSQSTTLERAPTASPLDVGSGGQGTPTTVGMPCAHDQVDRLAYDATTPRGELGWQGAVYCDAGDGLPNDPNPWTWERFDVALGPLATQSHEAPCATLYDTARTADNMALICSHRGGSSVWEYMSGENPNMGAQRA